MSALRRTCQHYVVRVSITSYVSALRCMSYMSALRATESVGVLFSTVCSTSKAAREARALMKLKWNRCIKKGRICIKI